MTRDKKKHVYTQSSKPDRPCHNCGCREFWNRGWGWICQRCHPCVRGVEKQVHTIPINRRVTVEVPYPGDVISVNHYLGRNKFGGEYVRAEAQAWMDAVGWLIKQHHIEEWRLPLRITCSGTFRDGNHAPDLSNLSKCALDAIEAVTGINDKYMRWQDGTREIVKTAEPALFITIEEAE